MFKWFDKTFSQREYSTDARTDMEKIGADISKVVPFPELKAVPSMAEMEPPKERTGKTVYSVGLTNDNRVSLIVGYGSVHMNAAGVEQLIDQLTLFKSQIESNEE